MFWVRTDHKYLRLVVNFPVMSGQHRPPNAAALPTASPGNLMYQKHNAVPPAIWIQGRKGGAIYAHRAGPLKPQHASPHLRHYKFKI